MQYGLKNHKKSCSLFKCMYNTLLFRKFGIWTSIEELPADFFSYRIIMQSNFTFKCIWWVCSKRFRSNLILTTGLLTSSCSQLFPWYDWLPYWFEKSKGSSLISLFRILSWLCNWYEEQCQGMYSYFVCCKFWVLNTSSSWARDATM